MSVSSIYKFVIDDVVKNIRQEFINEGIDEQIMGDLQKLWEAKLADTQVLQNEDEFTNYTDIPPAFTSPHRDFPQLPIPNAAPSPSQHDILNPSLVLSSIRQNVYSSSTLIPTSEITGADVASLSHYQPEPRLPSVASITSPINHQTDLGRPQPYMPPVAPWQAISAMPKVNPVRNMTNTTSSTSSSSSNNRLPPATALTGNVAQARGTKRTHSNITNITPQEESTSATPLKKQKTNTPNRAPNKKATTQKGNNTKLKSEPITQLDGQDDYDDVEFESPEVEEGVDLGPDLDDKDNEEEDETAENLVLCQFDKVTRTKNKWKCVLKDGIMHLKGRDYVFHKANGEFEW